MECCSEIKIKNEPLDYDLENDSEWTVVAANVTIQAEELLNCIKEDKEEVLQDEFHYDDLEVHSSGTAGGRSDKVSFISSGSGDVIIGGGKDEHNLEMLSERKEDDAESEEKQKVDDADYSYGDIDELSQSIVRYCQRDECLDDESMFPSEWSSIVDDFAVDAAPQPLPSPFPPPPRSPPPPPPPRRQRPPQGRRRRRITAAGASRISSEQRQLNNQREKARMHVMNDGFNALRNVLPMHLRIKQLRTRKPTGRRVKEQRFVKLTKKQTLQNAVDYIKGLTNLIYATQTNSLFYNFSPGETSNMCLIDKLARQILANSLISEEERTKTRMAIFGQGG